MVLANLRFVALEDGLGHFEMLLEESVDPRTEQRGVALIGDQIQAACAAVAGRRSVRRPILLQPVLHHRPQIFEKRLEQIGVFRDPGIQTHPFDELLLPFVVDLQAGRHPEQARKAALRGSERGQLVLNLDHRLRAAFGDKAVVPANRMNRHPAAREVLANRRLGFADDVRQRPIRQHGVALLLQIAPDGFALFAEVARGFGQKHGLLFGCRGRAPGRARRRPGGLGAEAGGRGVGRRRRSRRPAVSPGPFDRFQQLDDVVRQIVELDPEVAVRLGPKISSSSRTLPGFRIDLEELVADERAQLRRRACRAAPASSAP